MFVAMVKLLPFETAVRASVAPLAPQKEKIFENYFGTKKYFGLWMKQKWISKNTLMY